MTKLFEPLKIKSITIRNRIVVSPMCQYSSIDGYANEWHMVHLGTRAIGGAGVVFSEATAVSPEGRISPADLGIWKDEHITYLKKITDFILKHGAIPGIQLAHAGRKASVSAPWDGNNIVPVNNGGWPTVAPSAIPFRESDPVPVELSINDITQLVDKFIEAARRSLEAGFKILEIHAAHGYLINEFLSPVTNKRTDQYGGSFDNRIRVLLEIVDGVKKVWPQDLPIFVRISASEWFEEGWTMDDSVKLSIILKEKGVDVIDCSSGGNISGVKINIGPLYQTPFAEQIKKEAGIMTGAVGLITTAEQCEHIISEGKADLVFLARQLLRNPYFPLHAAKELGIDIKWPVQYERAK